MTSPPTSRLGKTIKWVGPDHAFDMKQSQSSNPALALEGISGQTGTASLSIHCDPTRSVETTLCISMNLSLSSSQNSEKELMWRSAWDSSRWRPQWPRTMTTSRSSSSTVMSTTAGMWMTGTTRTAPRGSLSGLVSRLWQVSLLPAAGCCVVPWKWTVSALKVVLFEGGLSLL